MTSAIFEESDRFRVVLTSRAPRKRRSRLNADRGSTLWAPRAIGWWIGTLFAVGAACFAVGALPGYPSAVGGEADALTFLSALCGLRALRSCKSWRWQTSTMFSQNPTFHGDFASLRGNRAALIGGRRLCNS
jgi:hypothetical protein